MKKNTLSMIICAFSVGGFSAAQLHAAESTPLTGGQFKDLRRAVELPKDSTKAYFVRVEATPVAQWQASMKASGKAVSKTLRAEYAKSVKAKLNAVIREVKARGFDVHSPVTVSDVGFTIFTTEQQAKNVFGLKDVKSVLKKQEFDKQRKFSTQWIGAKRAQEELGYTGKGQSIAIIDTGIDYLHADFKGSGLVSDFIANDPTIIEPGSFPTETVIGGYDFAGYAYDARFPESSTPEPDPDPLDDAQHGTHVAGIAAGRGLGPEQAKGVAPGADLYAFKVFGTEGSTSLTSEAIERAVDPNGDGDPSDAVDVINMSLGSSFGSPNDSSSVSAQNAVEAGVVVVAAAGNSGNNLPYISGAPGSAEGVISVASSIPGLQQDFFLSFTTGTGETIDIIAPYASISPTLTASLSGSLEISSPYDACSELENDFAGKVALITRGSCAFTDKLNNALAAGASAAVVVNNVAGAAITMGGSPTELPAAMISQSEGAILLGLLPTTSVEVEFSPDNIGENPLDDDTMSTFSSRGPGPTGFFKPDVTAPGNRIESALAGSGTDTLTISGTSMAAPQVAGMAALVREKFPDLGPTAVKAIIQNSAYPAKLVGEAGSPPLSLQGTGIVDVMKALEATAYASPGGLGFGAFAPEYNDARKRVLEITNFSDQDQYFDITVDENVGAGVSGASIEVASRIYVGAHSTQKVPVTMHVNADEFLRMEDFQEYDGWIVLTSPMSEMRVGYTAVISPASKTQLSKQGDTVKLRNVAFGDAEVYGFTLAGSQGANALGYRLVSPETVLFAVNASTEWNNFSSHSLIMSIDVDEDGVVDYEAQVADLRTLDSATYLDFTGVIASALDNLTQPQPTRQLLYVATTGINSSMLQFQLDTYGDFGFLSDDDSTFDYTLTLIDLTQDGAVNIGSGSIDLSKQAVVTPTAVALPAQGSASMTVSGSKPALLLIPTEAKSAKRVNIIKPSKP